MGAVYAHVLDGKLYLTHERVRERESKMFVLTKSNEWQPAAVSPTGSTAFAAL